MSADATTERMEQVVVCFACRAVEKVLSDSERVQGVEWPAWEPGLQPFPCPSCGEKKVWATEPRAHTEGDPE